MQEFYTELCDKEQCTIRKEAPKITSWEVDAALRGITNRTATGNDHINLATLKASRRHLLRWRHLPNAY